MNSMPAAVEQLPESFRSTTTVSNSMVGPALTDSASVGDNARSPFQRSAERRRGRKTGKKTLRGVKQTDVALCHDLASISRSKIPRACTFAQERAFYLR